VPKEEDAGSNRVKSGVTIASGFDLGQHSQKYLTKLGLSSELRKRLEPYMELKGETAKQALRAAPLYVTKAEAIAINKAVKLDKAEEAANLYNRDSELVFTSLDGSIQTVIMSVAFQYGDLSRRTPNFWGVVTKGDWNRAVWHLENFGDRYKTRRKKEAKVLRSHLKQKGLYNNV